MENTLKKRGINFCEGKLFGKIIAFVIPLIITNLLQCFYNSADMIVVGLSSEPDAVGSIGTTAAYVAGMLNIIIGFAVGVNVVVAFYIGKQNSETVSKTVHTAIIASSILGILCTILGISITNPILTLLGDEGRLLELASTYCYIFFISAPFTSITNCCSAILRAKGDTKSPLKILSISGLANVLLNLLFVLIFNMSVDGVAIATVISNVISAILLLLILSNRTDDCKFELKKLKFDGKLFGEILKTGLPASIQGIIFSASNMVIQSSIISVNNATVPIDSAYQPIVKGNAACSNIENFVYNATNAVYQATVTLVSQNNGAKKYDRIKSAIPRCYLITCIVALLFSGLIILFKDSIFSLFDIKNGDIGTLDYYAYHTVTTRIKYMIVPYFLLAFMEVGSGVVRGLGKSTVSTITTLMGAVVLRIIWIYTIFKANQTLESVYISYPISWLVTALVHALCYTILIHKVKNKPN